MDHFQSRWGLITGASAGIGAEFARQLAARGMNLILVARREDRLLQLARELHQAHGIEVRVLPVNLLAPGQPESLLQELQECCPGIDLLINNAGFGIWSRCEETDPHQVEEMLRLNILVLTRLTYGLLPGMLQRQSGAIINISSRAAFQPVPYMPAYAASKAYVLSFSEALWAEVQNRGVHVMAVCPGVIKTEFLDLAHMPSRFASAALTPADVVNTTIRGLARKSPTSVVGFIPRLLTLLPRILPRRMMARLFIRFLKPDDPVGE